MLSGRAQAPCKAPVPLRPARAAAPRRAVPARAEPKAELDDGALSEGEGLGSNLGSFCSIDSTGRRDKSKSLAEKESDFIEALQNYYFDGENKMTDEEFENLKDELVWAGSQVAVLSSAEQRFLEAMMSYGKGLPILSDDEFDELKGELKEQNSMVVQAGPRCSIRSRRLYSDATPDYLKLTLLNLPAALIVLGAIFAVDDFTGFEITKAIELPPPYSILFLWGLVFPTIYVVASSLTNLVLPDALILKAPCPNCNTSNQAYFGGIFSVAGNKRTSVVECTNCLADLEFRALRREVVIVKSSEEKKEEAEIKAKKKAASAAKKAAKAKAKAASKA